MGEDAGGEPGPDAAAEADALSGDAGALAVTGLTPRAIPEGAGSSGPPVPVLVEGAGFAPDLEVRALEAAESDFELEVERVEVSADGDALALALRAHPTDDLGEGDFHDVELEFFREGYHPATLELEIVGLDVLVLDGGAEDPSDFQDRYAAIAVEGDTQLIGDEAARLVAEGAIEIGAELSASAPVDDMEDSDIVLPGPGGCAGGSEEGDSGGCGEHGGSGGSEESSGAGGGGGGGHGKSGEDGEGSSGGSGGSEDDDRALLVPLGSEKDENDGAKGHGGGAGQSGALSLHGRGGGGGGVLELRAGGDLVITAEGRVAADGAPGGVRDPALGSCGGGGGAGSGGALLIRAGGELVVDGDVSARGGEIDTDTCSEPGGAGGDGRIRIDTIQRHLPDEGVEPAAVRGPLWREGLVPAIVTQEDLGDDGELEVPFFAQGSEDYVLSVDGEDVDEDSPEGSRGVVAAPLEPGLSELCLHIDASTAADLPESRNCRPVLLLP